MVDVKELNRMMQHHTEHDSEGKYSKAKYVYIVLCRKSTVKCKKTKSPDSCQGLYFRTGLVALCKALGSCLNACQQAPHPAYRHFCDRMIANRKNVGRPDAAPAGVHLGIESSTSAILIALDVKELNRMMLHHTEHDSKGKCSKAKYNINIHRLLRCVNKKLNFENTIYIVG